MLYGAAEFSRDTDLALLADRENLARLQSALDELGAAVIAVPSFELQYLERGHAVHFAFGNRATHRMRIDVMSRMRNVDPFPELWVRRTTFELDDMGAVDVLALPDLVLAKKTQRDKDWPMIRRLVEVNYLTYRDEATPERQRFWLTELRTPELLHEVIVRFAAMIPEVLHRRPWLTQIALQDDQLIADALNREEATERAADRQYWAPLVEELEALRRRTRH